MGITWICIAAIFTHYSQWTTHSFLWNLRHNAYPVGPSIHEYGKHTTANIFYSNNMADNKADYKPWPSRHDLWNNNFLYSMVNVSV